MSSSSSGKFVLRIPPDLHTQLKRAAEREQTSLNQYITQQLLQQTSQSTIISQTLTKVFGDALLGVIVFGSSVRGEARQNSDIDLLIVLDSERAITRELYSLWDAKIEGKLGSVYSPQFSHLPKDFMNPSSLWLEIALEGEVLLDNSGRLRGTLTSVRDRIASGQFLRKYSHGHPYWVRREELHAK